MSFKQKSSKIVFKLSYTIIYSNIHKIINIIICPEHNNNC